MYVMIAWSILECWSRSSDWIVEWASFPNRLVLRFQREPERQRCGTSISQGLVVRQKSPLNLEFQFAFLSDWLTPCEQFYVRSHFPAPDLNEAEWRLQVD